MFVILVIAIPRTGTGLRGRGLDGLSAVHCSCICCSVVLVYNTCVQTLYWFDERTLRSRGRGQIIAAELISYGTHQLGHQQPPACGVVIWSVADPDQVGYGLVFKIVIRLHNYFAHRCTNKYLRTTFLVMIKLWKFRDDWLYFSKTMSAFFTKHPWRIYTQFYED